MPFQTKSVWNLPVGEDVKNAGVLKLNDMISKQVQPVDQLIDQNTRRVTRTRYWVDLDAATEWANFVAGYNPVSVDVIEY